MHIEHGNCLQNDFHLRIKAHLRNWNFNPDADAFKNEDTPQIRGTTASRYLTELNILMVNAECWEIVSANCVHTFDAATLCCLRVGGVVSL